MHPCFIPVSLANLLCTTARRAQRVVLQRRLFGWWLLPLQVQCSDPWNFLLEDPRCWNDESHIKPWKQVKIHMLAQHGTTTTPGSVFDHIETVHHEVGLHWLCLWQLCRLHVTRLGAIEGCMVRFCIRLWPLCSATSGWQQVPSGWMFPSLRRGRRLPGRNLCASGNKFLGGIFFAPTKSTKLPCRNLLSPCHLLRRCAAVRCQTPFTGICECQSSSQIAKIERRWRDSLA